MCPLCPCQIWMSVWKGLTTATSMLSARTPRGHTSASASLATQGMANTAKVRLGGHLEERDLWKRANQCHCPQLATLHHTKARNSTGQVVGGGVRGGKYIFPERVPFSNLHKGTMQASRGPGGDSLQPTTRLGWEHENHET